MCDVIPEFSLMKFCVCRFISSALVYDVKNHLQAKNRKCIPRDLVFNIAFKLYRKFQSKSACPYNR